MDQTQAEPRALTWEQYPVVPATLLAALATNEDRPGLRFVHSMEVAGHIYLVAVDGFRFHALRWAGGSAGLVFAPMAKDKKGVRLAPVSGIKPLPELSFAARALNSVRPMVVGEADKGAIRALLAVPGASSLCAAIAPDEDGESVRLAGIIPLGAVRKTPDLLALNARYFGQAMAFVENPNHVAMPDPNALTHDCPPFTVARRVDDVIERAALIMPLYA